MDKSSGQCQWCALSYVWGGDVPLKTTKATQFIHKERIPIDNLPQTMKDAVDVCRGIGIRYLWIDALCIIQDDQEDLREELNHMPEVYQYATLTICAASSTSIYDGFLYRRGYWTHGCRPMNLRVAADCSESFILFVYMHLAFGVFDLRKDPIFKRAWTYQEYVLSPHILSYRTHHLEWKCRTHTELVGTPEFELPITKTSMTSEKIDGCEKGQQKVLMTNLSTYRLSSSTSWNDVVQEYTTRAASLASDKLRALSAVARVYRFETGKEYLAGLWKEDIPIALCWGNGPVGPQLRREYGPFLTSRRPREYRAPSWSWASIDTPVHYWHEHFGVPMKMRNLQVLSTGVTPTYPDGEFDSIASAFLALHGFVRAVPLKTPIELQKFRTKDPSHSASSIWIDEVRTSVYPDAFESQHETLDTLWLLLLADRVRDHLKVWTPAKFLGSFEERTITLI
ncbi:HET-domain-containing protein [Neurospora crassa]|uniref:Heterokaryon incompatibility domain-containing protein n=1 Tax=Neurospora crassa (strain ATCC 24698 / 74-OR23-1A / CBS 708.71 / DSM 1257 / FGSC 987) TaxID=367110 RepID=Q7SF07_NEUCR|nr:hypothetical protein NCU07448 [Neurospora crassa OR74A]EAA35399.3 hypothetical protein NCU07448 [Neurospora crassa OR74A]KHE80739.1 HET-domain-containing protein [Neurospora crassa]|eukprot:XP_964635.3 hypothetical protein NCU07448 [Neurospora crassa OR74A]